MGSTEIQARLGSPLIFKGLGVKQFYSIRTVDVFIIIKATKFIFFDSDRVNTALFRFG